MKQGSQLGKRSQVNEVDAPYIGVYYVAQVGVGSPATNHTLVLDTGSANTWSIQYAGTFYGEEWFDTVTLSPDLVINQQSIGVSHVFSFNKSDGIDGVLGIGPVDLTENTVDGVDTVLTVMDNLHSQGTISEEVLGVFFNPDLQVGALTFGSYDESAIRGPMLYFPVTTTPPASGFWGTELSIGYGNDTILSSAADVFSTSVPFIALAVDAYNNYKSKTGATLDLATGYLTITPEQYNNLESLVLYIGDVSFALTPNAQIWPRHLNYILGGSSDKIYLIVYDLGDQAEPGFEFIVGYTFLERFYCVFDTTNQRIGLADTDYTFSEVN
ncbi:aspartic proteinase [Boletus edulis]|nr:aspartic proteinase [Boletus edulis]